MKGNITDMTRPELTIVIPTYNEEGIIQSTLERVSAALGDVRSHTEVILADDGSDNLPAVIERIGGKLGFAEIKVMRNPVPVGKGESIRRAFQAARGAIVGFIDADLSVVPSFVLEAVREINAGSDMCIASRVGNRFKSDKSLMTSICATTFSFVHRRLIFGTGRTFTDTQCGFKFFKRKVALDLYRDLVALDGLTDLEVLLKAVRSGYSISELKVPRSNERTGKRKLSRIIVREAVSLWRIFLKYRL